MFREYFKLVPPEPILRELKTFYATLKEITSTWQMIGVKLYKATCK